jgi:hypothetical protein
MDITREGERGRPRHNLLRTLKTLTIRKLDYYCCKVTIFIHLSNDI